MLQDSLLQQLLRQTALLTQLVCAPAAERQPSQAAATQQAAEEPVLLAEQVVLLAEQVVPSEPLSSRERRQKRQGESLQKLEAEAALQQKDTPKTPQPAFPPRRQDSFHVPSRQDSQKSLGSQTSSGNTPTPRKLFQTPGSEENFFRDRQLQDLKEELKTPSPVPANLRIDWMFGKSAEKTAQRDLERDLAADRAREAASARLKQEEDRALEAARQTGHKPEQVCVLKTGPRKGGRPKGSKDRAPRPVNGLRKRRADVSAVSKLKLFQRADELVSNTGSKRDAVRRLQADFGISCSMAKDLMQPAKRAKVEQFVETTPQGRDGLRPQGSHLGLCQLASKRDQALQAAADPAGSQTLAVAEPHEFAANRAQTEITMSDQIPVWLKPTPGKVLTSLLRLKTAAEQSRVRQEARLARNADKKGQSAKDKAKARQRQTKVGLQASQPGGESAS